MKKLDRINELVDELNELKLGCMAASLDALYHSETFDELDAVSLLEQVIGPEYQNKTSQRFQNRLKRAHLSGVLMLSLSVMISICHAVVRLPGYLSWNVPFDGAAIRPIMKGLSSYIHALPTL